MFGGIFCDTTKVGLEDVVAVQEGHLAVRFYPHLIQCSVKQYKRPFKLTKVYLVLGILRKIVQRCYVQFELPRLRKLAEASAQADKIWPRYRDGEAH